MAAMADRPLAHETTLPMVSKPAIDNQPSQSKQINDLAKIYIFKTNSDHNRSTICPLLLRGRKRDATAANVSIRPLS